MTFIEWDEPKALLFFPSFGAENRFISFRCLVLRSHLASLRPRRFQTECGRATLTSALAGLAVVLLTTTGAKSGLPRTLPLLCIRDERSPSTFALVASNWGQTHYPAWYFNLKANPQAVGSIRGQVQTYVAHEASGEE